MRSVPPGNRPSGVRHLAGWFGSARDRVAPEAEIDHQGEILPCAARAARVVRCHADQVYEERGPWR